MRNHTVFHDSAFQDPESRAIDAANAERRGAARDEFPAEVVVLWHHQPWASIRYQMVDLSEGGLRLRSNLPFVEGSSATFVRILPEGTRLGRSGMVAWSRRVPYDGRPVFEAGFRFFD